MFAGAGAAALAVAAIGLALWEGVGTEAWQPCLFAFYGAVIILMLRGLLRAGMPTWQVCGQTFGVFGLAVAGLVTWVASVHAVERLFQGEPAQEILSQLFVFGVLGLAGSIVFIQCLRGRGWARRTAAVGAIMFLVVMVAQPFTGYGLLGPRPALAATVLPRQHYGIMMVVACAAVLALLPAGTDLAGRRRRGPRLVSAIFVVLLLASAGFAAYSLVHRAGVPDEGGWLSAARPATIMWVLAALWEALGLLPLVTVGLVAAWRRRGAFVEDLTDAVDFNWTLVALAALGCLALWLPGQWRAGGLPSLLLLAGILATMLGAWVGATHGSWAGRWALLPAAGLALGTIGTLKELTLYARGSAVSIGPMWVVATFWLWCCLVVGFTLAAAGLFVMRQRDRAMRGHVTLRADLRLLSTVGVALSGLFLCIWFARVAGDGPVKNALEGSRTALSATVKDVLALGGENPITAAALRAGSFVMNVPPRAGALAMLGVLLVHLLAAARVRWSFYVLAVLWPVPLIGCALLVGLHGWRLLFPVVEPAVLTGLGHMLAERFAPRLITLAAVTVLLVRLLEAYCSTLRLCGPGGAEALRQPTLERTEVAEPTGRRVMNPHHAFLLRAGAYASAAGLGVALLLRIGPQTNAIPFQFSLLGRQWLGAMGHFAYSVGDCSAAWPGYAVAGALVAYLLIAVHEEARQGRVAVYPLVAGSWVLLLLPHVIAWIAQVRGLRRPADPGQPVALALAGVVLAVLLLATCAMLVRWWALSRTSSGEPADILDRQDAFGNGRSLGSIGLILWLATSAAALHVALTGRMLDLGALPVLGRLVGEAAFWLEAVKDSLTESEMLHVVSGAVAGGSLVVLLLHVLSRHRISWARKALCVLWGAAILLGAAGAGYALSSRPLGEWTVGRLVMGMLLAAVLCRALVALTNAQSWLIRRTPGQ
jgi:hypothetical protein